MKNKISNKTRCKEIAGIGVGPGRSYEKPGPLSSKSKRKRVKMQLRSEIGTVNSEVELDADTNDKAKDNARAIESQHVTASRDFTNSVHPLLIDHVMDKIIGYTKANALNEWQWKQQLLELRQVNRTWNISATKQLQKLDSARWSLGACRNKKVSELIKLMETSAICPFTKLYLEPKFFTSENSGNLENVLVRIVPYLTELTVLIGQEFSIDFDVDKLNRLNSAERLDFSKLKVFKFRVSFLDLMTEKQKREVPLSTLVNRQKKLFSFFKILLEAATNLDHFEFFYPSGQLGDGTEELEPFFTDVICQSLPRKVKCLKLGLILEDRHLESLENLRLVDIQTLSFQVFGKKSFSEQRLKSFLASVKDSVITLQLHDYRGGREVDRNMKYPTMNNLKSLEMEVSDHSNLVCLDSFPKLHTLTIWNGTSRRSRWVWRNLNPHHSVTHVIIKDHARRHSVFFAGLPVVFPSVKSLCLLVSKNNVKSLSAIFKYLECLQELRLIFPVQFETLEVDSVLTGIPPELCRNMLHKKSYRDEDISGCERAYNLTDLKNLTKLRITGKGHAAFLSDVTAIFGFMELPYKVKIESDTFNMSENIIKALEASSRVQFPPREGKNL